MNAGLRAIGWYVKTVRGILVLDRGAAETPCDAASSCLLTSPTLLCIQFSGLMLVALPVFSSCDYLSGAGLSCNFMPIVIPSGAR